MKSETVSKARLLRNLLAEKPIVRIMGAHNALGAKLIQKTGFEGVWASGLEISTAHGVPDANIMTMTENLHEAQNINSGTALPVVCDCDTGYGNASNVIHMVKRYEAADLAAAVIEDKLFPKVNSFIPGRQELASIEEFAGKIEAAKSAQQTPDFLVFARCEALIAGWGIEEALKRAHAYADAGADGIVIHSKSKTPDEVFQFAGQWKRPLPLIVIPTTFFNVSADDFARHGFKMVIYANQGLRSSIKAMKETFAAIERSGSTASVEDKIAPMAEVFDLQGMSHISEEEKKFSKKSGIQAIIPAAGDHRSQPALNALLQDRPLCMLEVAGKSLLDRQMDLLRSVGISDIFVIGGYLADKIKADGATLIKNPDYQSRSIAYSIMLAQDRMKDKCLVLYSDIIFDRLLLDRLISSPHPITLVMDKSWQHLPHREKQPELVTLTPSVGNSSGRKLDYEPFKKIERVGKQADPKQAQHEFIGIAYLREEGLKELKRLWTQLNSSGAQLNFTDLIQKLIDAKFPVHGMEIEGGWSEIHSRDDYERVRQYFQKSS